jgi:pimeloyl-ACP methyl ester carboxylesterase
MAIERRHLIATRHGAVHVRVFGDGPPLVGLHASPRSSLDLVALATRLSDRFTVILVDTPGFGWSDPLPFEQPYAEDFADAIAEALDRFGVAGAAFYAAHTGAQIALEIGARHPQLISGLVADGLPLLTPAEREAWLAGTIPDLAVKADGSHLTWIWSRARDGAVFMPFNIVGTSARSVRAFPPVELIDRAAMELLRAGEQWRDGYFAAFRHETAEKLGQFITPVRLTCREGDALLPHLQRLPLGTETEVLPAHVDDWAQRIGELALEWPAGSIKAHAPAPRRRSLVTIADRAIQVRRSAGPGPLIVLLTSPTRAGRSLEPALQRLNGRAELLQIDLPGTGGSDALASTGSEPMIEALAHIIGQETKPPGIILGEDDSSGIALGLSQRFAVPAVGLGSPSPATPPSLEPDLQGGHLLKAWWHERDRLLWDDDERRRPRAHPTGHDPHQLQRATLDLLEARGFDADSLEAIRQLPKPTQWVASSPSADVAFADELLSLGRQVGN